MITALLRRELCAGLAGDEVSEGGLTTFEFARFGVGPVGDFLNARVRIIQAPRVEGQLERGAQNL
jgi:hypothetical protein